LSHTIYFWLLLFITGLSAATVDAIAGGGGLISLPVLLGVGVPPQVALGTNKLQSSLGTFMAATKYYRQGWFSIKTLSKGLLFGIIGAMLGSVAGQGLSTEFLHKLIPVLMLVILIYTIFSPTLGHEAQTPKMSEQWFYIIFGFTLGFYDGIFGPGTGSLWVFSLTFFLGYHFRNATAYAKVFNLKSNIIAAICFGLGSNIDYRIALCMAAGQFIGGQLGAHLAIKKGAQIIRPIFIIVVSVSVMSLVYKNYLHDQQTWVILLAGFSYVVGIGGIYFWNNKKMHEKAALKLAESAASSINV
jgi:uncharacterized membrane protein YfcA